MLFREATTTTTSCTNKTNAHRVETLCFSSTEYIMVNRIYWMRRRRQFMVNFYVLHRELNVYERKYRAFCRIDKLLYARVSELKCWRAWLLYTWAHVFFIWFFCALALWLFCCYLLVNLYTCDEQFSIQGHRFFVCSTCLCCCCRRRSRLLFSLDKLLEFVAFFIIMVFVASLVFVRVHVYLEFRNQHFTGVS